MTNENRYKESINRVIYHIDTHLEEDFNLEKLAELAHFSPFHFHRIIRAYLREPLWTYVVRVRLDTAARLLRYTEMSISEVFFKVGYDSPAAFSRAFKKRFGISPQEFRESSTPQNETIIPSQNINYQHYEKMKVKIVKLDPKKVVYIQANEGYKEEVIAPIWNSLMKFMKENRLFWFTTEFIGISLDDPKITEPDRCRYEACISVRKEIKPQGEIGYKVIAGGKYAVFRHKGPYENFNNTYNFIYGQWLDESGQQLRDCPAFEKYINQPGKTKPEKLITDIYVPIQ